jgi:hypothetical protein
MVRRYFEHGAQSVMNICIIGGVQIFQYVGFRDVDLNIYPRNTLKT